jgi:hypothetical protein
MVILLILGQVALLVLQYGAHVINLSLWIVLLPAILLTALWLFVVLLMGHMLTVNSINPVGRPKR